MKVFLTALSILFLATSAFARSQSALEACRSRCRQNDNTCASQCLVKIQKFDDCVSQNCPDRNPSCKEKCFEKEV